MKFHNICTRQAYTKKDGTEKVNWLPAGTLRVNDDGKMFIQLNHLPDVNFYVFEQKPKETQSPQQAQYDSF